MTHMPRNEVFLHQPALAYRNLMTRDASGTREPGRRWEPGTGNRDAGGTQNFFRFEILVVFDLLKLGSVF